MNLYPLFVILIAAAVIITTRFVPFLLLGRGEEPPAYIVSWEMYCRRRL